MSADLIQQRLLQHFPELHTALAHVPLSAYQLIEAPAGTTIFDIGGACENYILMTSGTVSVKMLTKSGKSVLLYRVEPGQSCIITTSCLLGDAHYPTFGQADTAIEALSISHSRFSLALDQSNTFRRFVFDGLGRRLADVMYRLESLNFTPIDARLAEALLNHGRLNQQIDITHEVLAEEIGSAREVVSRHLKKMETAGLLRLERGSVVLDDVAGLENLKQ